MFRLIFIPIVAVIASSPVFAQSLPHLSKVERQRLSRDLFPTDSQNFFKQGHDQLEQETQLLKRRSTTQQEKLLIIEPASQEYENPKTVQPGKAVKQTGFDS